MSIEQFGGFTLSADKKAISSAEKLKNFRKELLTKTKNILKSFGLDFSDENNLRLEKEIMDKAREIKNNNEDDKFIDLEFEHEGKNLNLRTVAQIDPNYNFDRNKNYNEWDLTPQEEAERWLNREILVGEKLNKYFTGETVLADKLIKANRQPKEGSMFLLKQTQEQTKEVEDYGEAEGRAITKTLLDLQTNLRATEMIREIMSENNIKSKLEMEQKIFEDYFDNFDGYLDNSKVILEELGDEELAEKLEANMEEYRATIEDCQLDEAEFSFVHGNVNFETIKYADNGRAYLADWQKAGKTQNKELSLVYDLGNILQEAIEKFDDIDQTKEFINGIEAELKEYYRDQPEIATAVINLAKFRSFAMMVNDQEGDKKDYILESLNEK